MYNMYRIAIDIEPLSTVLKIQKKRKEKKQYLYKLPSFSFYIFW